MSRGIGVLMVFVVMNTGTAVAKQPRPDLVVGKSPAVASVLFRGTQFSVGDVIKNKGKARAGRSTVRYYLSLDKKRDRGDTRLNGKRGVKRLRPKKKSRGRAKILIPANVPLGRYRLLSCADDRRKVKESRERNNCRASKALRLTLAPVLSAPLPGPDPAPGPMDPAPDEPTSTGPADTDGDGATDDVDCQPLDQATHPGAPDEPDTEMADTNCDGIDGDASQAIFVSTLGANTNPGTKDRPKRTIQNAVTTAASVGKAVYIAVGTYDETLPVANGVSVYGGFGTDWTRPSTDVTRLVGTVTGGDTEAANAVGISSPTTLQQLTLTPGEPTAPGRSSYGLRIVNSPALTVDNVVATGAPGRSGATGGPGANGARGGDGVDGHCGGHPAGGSSAAGQPGGHGGMGDFEEDGKPGQPGSIAGQGGGAGGAGGEMDSGDGGIGFGGQWGSPGGDGGGGAGGPSVALYRDESSITSDSNTLSFGQGGAGGRGGDHTNEGSAGFAGAVNPKPKPKPQL